MVTYRIINGVIGICIVSDIWIVDLNILRSENYVVSMSRDEIAVVYRNLYMAFQ